MLVSTEGGGAKLHLKCLSLGHCGKLFVSGQRYKHIFENFKRRNINGFPCGGQGKCHPELTFSLAQRKSMQKECKTEGLPEQLCHPELDSGSSQRYIIPNKKKINNISFASNSAKRHVKGDFVTQKESETGKLHKLITCHPELGSGSCQRYIIPNKKKINNISFASNSAKRHVKGDLVTRRVAFTLAEVLITLGIIGVVAAMTLPTLIAKHEKQEVVTKLKKVYSVMNQAIQMSETVNGEAKYWDGVSTTNPFESDKTTYSELKAWYDKYLGPYLKTTKIIQAKLTDDDTPDPTTGALKNQGMLVYFADGTILRICNYIRDMSVYTNEKAIKSPIYGRNMFYFRFSPTESVSGTGAQDKFQHGKKFEPYAWNWNGTREDLMRQGDDYGCTENGGAYCTKLIQFDGWQIKDDYPVKF